MSWLDPVVLNEYRRLNEACGENPPKESPVSEPFAGLDIRVGPILRLAGTFETEKNYRATILLGVFEGDQSPPPPKITYQIAPASKQHGGGKPGEKTPQESGSTPVFKGEKFFNQDQIALYRYNIDLQLGLVEQKVKYFINTETKPGYQFFIPGETQLMNIVSYSCNGFSLGTPPGKFKSSLWYDVLKKHGTQQPYHVMIGGGDQIYADSVKLASVELEKWVNQDNYIKKRKQPATPELMQQLEHYYFHHYLEWFGKGFWQGKNGTTLQALFPEALAQIPSVNIFDDHDIIDGFGSYHDYTMRSEVFIAIGNVAYKYYMIFQHHMSPQEGIYETDGSWILGHTKGPFIKEKSHSNYLRLGKEIAFVGVDCRTERKLKQVVSRQTYAVMFSRLKNEIVAANGDIKHLLVLLGVPIFYPRLVWVEWLLTSTIFKPLRALATKGILDKGLVNEFDGDVELLDDLNDHWCARHHKKERNQLVQDLIQLGSSHGVRITILSGDVHLGCVGRIHTKIHRHHREKTLDTKNEHVEHYPENDPRLMFNIISSAIVNGPPPDGMATLLNKRTKTHRFDLETDEDVVALFDTDVDGTKRENTRFLNKRNWSDLILAKHSKYEVGDGTEVERKRPGSGTEGIKYPLFADSLVATLHFEKDPANYDADTADYEVVIPKMAGRFKLERDWVKHLA